MIGVVQHFVASVLGIHKNIQSEDFPPASARVSCNDDAVAALMDNCVVRGCGLCVVCEKYICIVENTSINDLQSENSDSVLMTLRPVASMLRSLKSNLLDTVRREDLNIEIISNIVNRINKVLHTVDNHLDSSVSIRYAPTQMKEWTTMEFQSANLRLQASLVSYDVKPSIHLSIQSHVSIPTVSDGLLRWQIHRLQSGVAMSKLYIACRNNMSSANDTFIYLVLSILPKLGYNFMGPMYDIFHILLDHILDCYKEHLFTQGLTNLETSNGSMDYNVDSNEEKGSLIRRQLLSDAIKNAFKSAIFGFHSSTSTIKETNNDDVEPQNKIKDVKSIRENYMSLSHVILNAQSVTSASLSDWIAAPHVPTIPLSSDWMYRYCNKLCGRELWSWLSILHAMESTWAKKISEDAANNSVMTWVPASQRLYYLTRLTTHQYASHWFDVFKKNPARSELMASNIHDDGEDDGYETCLCPDDTVTVFQELLSSCLVGLCTETAADRSFASVARGESPSLLNSRTTLNMISQSKDVFAVDHWYNNKLSNINFVGLAEYAGKLIDAALAPATSHELHALALLPLLHTELPWSVREKIWREFGTIGFLHLLDSPIIHKYVSALIAKQESSLPVVKTMVEALCKLRCSEDRMLVIIRYALHQISNYLFRNNYQSADNNIIYNNNNDKNRQQKFKKKFLMEIISAKKMSNSNDNNNYENFHTTPRWLLMAVFHHGFVLNNIDKVFRNQNELESKVGSSLVWQRVSDSIVGIWNSFSIHDDTLQRLSIQSVRELLEPTFGKSDSEEIIEMLLSQRSTCFLL